MPALAIAPRPRGSGRWLGALLVAALASAVQAQASSCNSDGRPAPTALLERFMDADCMACWQSAEDGTPPQGSAVLDWVLPSAREDEAAMSAVAMPEARERLLALGLHMTEPAVQRLSRRLPGPVPALRVAQGFPVNGYLGATLRYAARDRQSYTAWLLLVEQVPAGVEGSPVARQLVRAAAELRPGTVDGRPNPLLSEVRAFRLPEGARPERLRVLAWVQDESGRLKALAQTRCPTERARAQR